MLLDLNMPYCSGFGVLDWLRQHPHLQSLPTVVFTNSNQPSDIDQSRQLGAHGYWVKPSRFEDLVKLMVGLKETLHRVTERVESEFQQPLAV
jgi:CheY-like chemotaxis protein